MSHFPGDLRRPESGVVWCGVCVCVCVLLHIEVSLSNCMHISETLSFQFSFAAKSRLKDLLLQIDNQLCADCGAPDPKWA